MHDSVVIGIVYQDGTLTTATRRGRAFGAITQQGGLSDGDALARIYELANVHRHDNPMYHLSGDDVPRIVASIRKAGINCDLFSWFAQVNDSYANLGSRQLNELREQINAGLRTGVADDVLAQELEAFKREESAGKVRFSNPDATAEALERYPARALAILLAGQYEGGRTAQFRPLASGYVPVAPTAGGHDPLAVLEISR
jgi:hypothetical protein